MAVEDPISAGTPRWRDGGVEFHGVQLHPDHVLAGNEWQEAHQAWHDFIDGTRTRQIVDGVPTMVRDGRIPHNQPLEDFHIDLKARTNLPPAPGVEVRAPFWNAQAELAGYVGFPEGTDAIRSELKHAYLEHAGPQTTRLINATNVLREHELHLANLQAQALELADSLPGHNLAFGTAAAPGPERAAIIQTHADGITALQRSKNHAEQFLTEMPEIEAAIAARGTHTPPPAPPPPPPHEPGAINPREAVWDPALNEGRGGIAFLGETNTDELISCANARFTEWEQAIANSSAITTVHEQIRAEILAADPTANATQILTDAREAIRVGDVATGVDADMLARLRAAYAEHIPGEMARLLDVELSMTNALRQMLEAQLELLRVMPVPEGIDPAHFRTTIDQMIGNYERVITFADPTHLTHVQDYLNTPALQEALAGRRPPPLPLPLPLEHPTGGGGGHGGGGHADAGNFRNTAERLQTQAEHMHGQGAAGRMAQTAEVLESQASKLHTTNKTLAIAGATTLVLGLGAMLLSPKVPARAAAGALAPEKPRTIPPIKTQSVQLGAEQKIEPEKKQWASSLRSESTSTETVGLGAEEKTMAEKKVWTSSLRTETANPASLEK